MDLYDESRTLVYLGPVMRRRRTDTGFSEKWLELTAALLDNYCRFIFYPDMPISTQAYPSYTHSRRKTLERYRQAFTHVSGVFILQSCHSHFLIQILHLKPLPLSFLRLGAFNTSPELRREKADDGGLLDRYRTQSVPMYPFTIYHASSRSTRRYTLYTASEVLRKKWYNSFVDAIGVHKVRQEANMVRLFVRKESCFMF